MKKQRKKPGPKSMEEELGEEVTSFRFLITKRQLEKIKRQAQDDGLKVAEYIRRRLS